MQTPRIVIIEDEMIIAHDVKQTLVNMGYEVPLVTGSGEAALKKIKDIRPDLVLMDIMLKGRMNGIDAAAKTHDIYNIPVVYMTANADKKTIERAKKTEPYGLIYKPVKSEVLHAVIEMALYKHKMESKLIEHDAQLKATLNSIGDAVISTDKNSKIVSMNPVAEKLTGWNFNDAEGRPLTEVFNIVNALTGEKAVNPVKKVLELGTIVGLANHTKLISKDGNEYQIADSGSPIIDINGEITGVVMVFRDVTEEYNARQKLKRLAAIVESSFDAIIGTSLDGTIISWNKAAERMLGYTEKEVVGKKINIIIPDENRDEEEKLVKQLQRGIKVQNFETIRKRKGGELLSVSITISPVKDEFGKTCGASSIIRDISEQKQAEQRINHLNRILRSIRDVNQLITKEENRDALLRQSCEILTDNEVVESIMIVLFDGNNGFSFATQAGIKSGFQLLVKNLKRNKLPFCIKSSFGKKGLFFIEEVKSECKDCPVLSAHADGGSVAVRLEYNKKIYGVMCSKVNKKYMHDGEITGLLEEISGDISNAIYRLELEEEHRKAEETIHEKEIFMTSVFESVQDGISVLTPDLTIRHVNNVMKRWYESNLPLEGKKCYQVYHNADKPCNPCPSLRCLDTGKTERDIVPGLPGSPVEWIELFSYPLRDKKTNKIRGVIEFVRDITDRKKAEKALMESEGKFRNLADSILDGVAITIDGKNYWINTMFAKITGYSKDELIGKSVDYLIVPEEVPKLKKFMVNCLSGKAAPFNYETMARRKDGKIINLDVMAKKIEFEGKDAIQVVIRDITKRKQMEQKLWESEEKYRNLVETTNTGYLIVDDKGMVVDANQEYVRLTGHSKLDEIMGRSVLEWTAEHHFEKNKTAVSECAKNGYVRDLEIDYVDKNGDITTIEINANVIDTKEGKRILILCRDITERKRMEDALRESKERFKKLSNLTFEGILIHNKGVVVDMNESLARMIGYTREELIGENVIDICIPAEFQAVIKRNISNNSTRPYEAAARRKDGTVFPIEIESRNVKYGDDKFRVTAVRDITERKKTEEQIRKDLEEKEVLLKEVNHRVKNNLNVITSLLNLQSSKLKTKEEAIDAFNDTRDRVYAMAMVHEKLYRSGDYTKINMREYTKTLGIRLLQIYSRGINIKCDYNIEDVSIDMNRAIPCGLILNELISNAFKHAFKNRSEGKIFVSFKQIKSSKYEIIVRDNGCGLPENIDIENTDSMGLRLIKILTEQLEGKLSVKTERGTEFKIVFPYTK